MAGVYYLMLRGKSVGPLRAEHFPTLAKEGLITHRSLVREQGTGDVRPLYRHPDVAKAVFGSRAPLVTLKGTIEEYRARPLVGIVAGFAAGVLSLTR